MPRQAVGAVGPAVEGLGSVQDIPLHRRRQRQQKGQTEGHIPEIDGQRLPVLYMRQRIFSRPPVLDGQVGSGRLS